MKNLVIALILSPLFISNSSKISDRLGVTLPTVNQIKLSKWPIPASQGTVEALVITPVVPVVKPVAVSGSCSDWLVAAGVTDIVDALALISGESGCNPLSYNSSSGACGVAQELPCGKSGCSLGDGACEVKWMNSYIQNRYSTWANAYATWLSRSPHWY